MQVWLEHQVSLTVSISFVLNTSCASACQRFAANSALLFTNGAALMLAKIIYHEWNVKIYMFVLLTRHEVNITKYYPSSFCKQRTRPALSSDIKLAWYRHVKASELALRIKLLGMQTSSERGAKFHFRTSASSMKCRIREFYFLVTHRARQMKSTCRVVALLIKQFSSNHF